MHQDVPGPATVRGHCDIIFPLLIVFTLFQDDDIVAPADFCHKLWQFFFIMIG